MEKAGQPVVGEVCLAHHKRWELTPEAFGLLLAAFDAEPEQAGAAYVRVYERLCKYFECRGCVTPEELADETLNRVARRLAEGETIRAEQPLPYCYGVARNVLREARTRPESNWQSLAELPSAAHPREDPHERRAQLHQRAEKERWLELLADCVAGLPAPSRALLSAYDGGEQRTRIEQRRALAEALGITTNALKIRVFRIRAGLEKRLLEQLQQLRAHETKAPIPHTWTRSADESCHTPPVSESLSFDTCSASCQSTSKVATKRSISATTMSSLNC
jgi:DNA-directed RNA polymerase specialized sigma24 family protein